MFKFNIFPVRFNLTDIMNLKYKINTLARFSMKRQKNAAEFNFFFYLGAFHSLKF